MKTIGQKIKEQRERNGLTQRELGEKTGLTVRTVSSYETDAVTPRGINIKRICTALDISEAYLTNPDIEDAEYGKEEAPYVDSVRSMFGKKAGVDMQSLLEANQTYFAGGDIPQEDKDLFFNAVMEAYVATKKDAKAAFTPNKYRK
jgi:transcriptional regulator with XRE-family HTH domain